MNSTRTFCSGPTRKMTRREMLTRCSTGFGALALLGLTGSLRSEDAAANILQNSQPHFEPKAKSVIFLYMDGGPSQVDTFDPKPRLREENGKPFGLSVEPTQFNSVGGSLGSPWEFKKYGESGIPVSGLFPHIGSCADDIAVIRSMYSEFSEHTNGIYFLHTGHGLQGRPSMGAWVTYGLGSENENLPGFVVLDGGLIPPGGLDVFTNGFLPATYQGSIFHTGDQPISNVIPPNESAEIQQNRRDLVKRMDDGLLNRLGHAEEVESAIANYELAFRMQSAVPELADLSGETAATKRLYGFEAEYAHTRSYAAQCLLARRLVERGTRFIELTCPKTEANRWDQHGGLTKGHAQNALAIDQPIAGLLKDLKSRGLLDETLVVWAGEFGRTPFSQGNDGRDHNPWGFSIWMAGAGIKGGTVYGATDEYGYKAVENRVSVHDLHATILQLLGIDHERLTYRFSGRDIRLTDVYGNIIEGVLT